MPGLHYIHYWPGIAESLRAVGATVLSSIPTTADENGSKKKLDCTAIYIPQHLPLIPGNHTGKRVSGKHPAVARCLILSTPTRDNELNKLCKKLSDAIDNIDQQWDMNRRLYLARSKQEICKALLVENSPGYVDELIGQNSNYAAPIMIRRVTNLRSTIYGLIKLTDIEMNSRTRNWFQ